MKRPKTECPFRVGDVVRASDRAKATCLPKGVFTVTKVDYVPAGGNYIEGVKDCPYWVWVKDSTEAPVVVDEKKSGIWVGFLELDPFLGAAKRAIQDADIREH